MVYKWKYKTPQGFSDMIMNSDGDYLTGLYFDGTKCDNEYSFDYEEKELPIFRETCKWLDIYFSGNEPDFIPKFRINSTTPFRKDVQEIMLKIPFGKTITYGDIAKEIADERGIDKMSAQAVGGAVGWNPICIIVPCHRVVGVNGNLTGYGGGMENKIALLELEGNHIDMETFFVPICI